MGGELIAHPAQLREMRARMLGIVSWRRNCHQSRDLNFVAHLRDQPFDIVGRGAVLGRLAPEINFDKNAHRRLWMRAMQRLREPRGMKAVDQLEHRARLSRLVGLQMADQMESDIAQIRERVMLGGGFLHVIFTEYTRSRAVGRAKRARRLCLAGQHEAHRIRVASRSPGGRGNSVLHHRETPGNFLFGQHQADPTAPARASAAITLRTGSPITLSCGPSTRSMKPPPMPWIPYAPALSNGSPVAM